MRHIDKRHELGTNSIRGLATGVVSGIFITLFANTIAWAGKINQKYWFLFLLLPLGAVATFYLYKWIGDKYKKATVFAIDDIHEHEARKENNLASFQKNSQVSPLMGIAGYISATISHLLGASVGKEGVGVQIGLSVGALIDKIEDKVAIKLKLEEVDSTAYYMMSGASAAFGSLFSSPIAGALFGLQFASPDMLRLDALLPCIFASFSATLVANALGIHILQIPGYITLDVTLKNILIAFIFALLAGFVVRLFCLAIEKCKELSGKRHGRLPALLSVAIPSAIISIILLAYYLETGSLSFNGLSTSILYSSISGNTPMYSFLFKALLILLSILSGFIGGEVVPLLVLGATFGYSFASLLSLPTGAFASLGALAVLSGGTNLPLVCFALGLELFHYNEPWILFIAVAGAYSASGNIGIYDHQKTIMR